MIPSSLSLSQFINSELYYPSSLSLTPFSQFMIPIPIIITSLFINDINGTIMVIPISIVVIHVPISLLLSQFNYHRTSLSLSQSLSFPYLVGGSILKNMKVNGKDYPIYYGK